MLITHGDTFSELGPLKGPGSDVLRQELGAGLKVGYKYSYGGLFWIDVWTWGGEYCVYRDMSYEPITKEVAAALLGTTPDKLGKPFFYRFPHVPFFLAVLVGPLCLFGLWSSRADAKREERLLENDSYQKALATALGGMSGTPSKERFEDGVKDLVFAGIGERQARKELKFLIDRVKAEAKAA